MSQLLRRSETVIFLVVLVAVVAIGIINPAAWELGNIFSLLRANVITGIMALGVLTVLISGHRRLRAVLRHGRDVRHAARHAEQRILRRGAAIHSRHADRPTARGAECVLRRQHAEIPLIVTLGTGTMVRGFLLGVIGTANINIDRMPQSLMHFASLSLVKFVQPDGTTIELSAMLVTYLALALLVHLLLRYTMIGRGVYAMGETRRRRGGRASTSVG